MEVFEFLFANSSSQTSTPRAFFFDSHPFLPFLPFLPTDSSEDLKFLYIRTVRSAEFIAHVLVEIAPFRWFVIGVENFCWECRSCTRWVLAVVLYDRADLRRGSGSANPG